MRTAARVAIIMPVFNEAKHLPRVLESLASQTFDRERMKLIAVDGGSTDGSAHILRRWLEESGFSGCVMENPKRKIPISLNVAIREAAPQEIVLRLDAHTSYGATYVEDAVHALQSAAPDVACVGGAQRPGSGVTFGQRVVEALYTNPLGLGGADFRRGQDVREVDSVYLGVWRPGVLAAVRGFDERMDANEDAELAARLREMGWRLLRVPLPSAFMINRGALETVRQWNRYGYWRARMLKMHPRSARLRHIVSFLAAPGFVGLMCSRRRALLLPLFAAYAFSVFRFRAKGEPLGVTLASAAYFPVVQTGFAIGMFRGLLGAAPRSCARTTPSSY